MFDAIGGWGTKQERCGMLLTGKLKVVSHGDVGLDPTLLVTCIVELPNRAQNREENFSIWQSDVDRAMEWLKVPVHRLMGFWHSHPPESDFRPSQDDLDSITLGEKNWWHVVYTPDKDRLYWYDYAGDRIVKHDSRYEAVRYRKVQLKRRTVAS